MESRYLRRLTRVNNSDHHLIEPTRVTAPSATLIDHVITDQTTILDQCGVIDVVFIIYHPLLHLLTTN